MGLWHWLQHWLAVHTGTESAGPDKYYNWWSGFGSDIGELAVVGGLVTIVRHANCHKKGCWRLGRHRTTIGHKLCSKHIGMSLEELGLHEVHDDHTPN